MNNLPYDLICEILNNFDGKTLSFVRCVCKLWNNIIVQDHQIWNGKEIKIMSIEQLNQLLNSSIKNNLSTIDLEGTRVTDEGIKAIVEGCTVKLHLRKNLCNLYVESSKILPEVKELLKSRKNKNYL